MTEETKQKFARYEELKIEEKAIKAEIAMLGPDILKEMPEDVEVQGKMGVFVVQNRSTWTYTDNVTIAEDNVKDLKAEEQAKGIASTQSTPTLYYKQNKKQKTPA